MNAWLAPSYLFIGMSLAIIACVGIWRLFSRTVRYHDRMALIFIVIILCGMTLHSFWAFLLRQDETHTLGVEIATPVVIVRLCLITFGVFGLVRRWTYEPCGERGWILLAGLAGLLTVVVDYLI